MSEYKVPVGTGTNPTWNPSQDSVPVPVPIIPTVSSLMSLPANSVPAGVLTGENNEPAKQYNPDSKDGWTHDGYGAYSAKQNSMTSPFGSNQLQDGQTQNEQPHMLSSIAQPAKDWINSEITQPVSDYVSNMFSSDKPSDNDPTISQD